MALATRQAEGALFRRAVGYDKEFLKFEAKPIGTKGSGKDHGLQVYQEQKRTGSRVGMVLTERTTKHYPPEVEALKFYLANKDQDHWRLRQEISQEQITRFLEIDHMTLAERVELARELRARIARERTALGTTKAGDGQVDQVEGKAELPAGEDTKSRKAGEEGDQAGPPSGKGQ
jgi:hypothetical protein